VAQYYRRGKYRNKLSNQRYVIDEKGEARS
jgi:hypothetical protein